MIFDRSPLFEITCMLVRFDLVASLHRKPESQYVTAVKLHLPLAFVRSGAETSGHRPLPDSAANELTQHASYVAA
jgi:hypothetical protein